MPTHAALLTPRGTGAIAVIALRGPDALSITRQLAPTLPASLAFPTTRRANLRHNNQPLDDALLLLRSPADIEFHIHGGIAVIDLTFAALTNCGATQIAPEDFPATAPPSSWLLRAQTPRALRLLANQHPSKLHDWANQQKNATHPWQIQAAAQHLLATTAIADRLFNPPTVILLGPPNSGKSTLLNALAGRTASSVSPLAGTTRDWVEARIPLGDPADPELVIRLIDTAGLHATTDPLESRAMEITQQLAANADAWLILNKAATPPDPTFLNSLDPFAQPPTIWLNTQIDRATLIPPTQVASNRYRTISLSAHTGAGLETLMTQLAELFEIPLITPDTFFPTDIHHRALLQKLAHTDDHPTINALLTKLTL
jgi:tRNA modification GTPase